MIYHITTKREWTLAEKKGEYTPSSLEKEGFIHFCTKNQMLTIANRFYKGQKNLVILCIEENQFGSNCKWEAAEGFPEGENLFPHIYKSIPTQKVNQLLFISEITEDFSI